MTLERTYQIDNIDTVAQELIGDFSTRTVLFYGDMGVGKTTLIKAILGIIKPIAGSIAIYDKPYEEQRKMVAYVPQKGSVAWDFPTTALDVVKMGTYGSLGWIKRPGKKEKKAALEALEKVGMLAFKNRQISQLSGGQQQRVFLARALVQNVAVYFY